MAADFSFIVTKEKVIVPPEHPHFIKNGVVTIALDTSCVEWFITDFTDGTLQREYDPANIFSISEEFFPDQIYRLIQQLDIEYKEFAIGEDSIVSCYAVYRSGKLVLGPQHLKPEKLTNGWSSVWEELQINEQSVAMFHHYHWAMEEYADRKNI